MFHPLQHESQASLYSLLENEIDVERRKQSAEDVAMLPTTMMVTFPPDISCSLPTVFSPVDVSICHTINDKQKEYDTECDHTLTL